MWNWLDHVLCPIHRLLWTRMTLDHECTCNTTMVVLGRHRHGCRRYSTSTNVIRSAAASIIGQSWCWRKSRKTILLLVKTSNLSKYIYTTLVFNVVNKFCLIVLLIFQEKHRQATKLKNALSIIILFIIICSLAVQSIYK